ncbi:hypothetical protein SCHPADRAFT_1002969 [Schizopora paradoxa]|uniref:Protein kinase domain-containing protein n=1 Tax=Schizopora paradoxa TaxID=27342 RepID=A0A0H2R772_9AGAM|nr:hypothetical protein SCHPADRAFT_1002969 [Schizopora paradoxa]
MLDLSRHHSVQIPIPLWGNPLPDCDPFLAVDMHKNYPKDSSLQDLSSLKIRDFEELQREFTYGVLRAWVGPRDVHGSNSFIIKFAIAGSDKRHKALRREAAVYHEQLSSLQGKDIPKFFGYYEGSFLEDEDEDEDDSPVRVSCIFLEDCGDAVDCNFGDLPLADRAEIMKKVGRVHQCGLILDDFQEQNVVSKGSSYRLIDFQHVETGHKCPWKGGRVYEGQVIPTFDQIGCPALHNVGLELQLWRSRLSVVIFGKTRPKRDFPTQKAIDILCRGIGSFHFENEKRLHNWIRNYKEFEARMTPEEYMTKYPRPDFGLPPKQLGKDEYE